MDSTGLYRVFMSIATVFHNFARKSLEPIFNFKTDTYLPDRYINIYYNIVYNNNI